MRVLKFGGTSVANTENISRVVDIILQSRKIASPGESSTEALKRCYKKLLDVRSVLYKKYADVIIPRGCISDAMDIKKFLRLIEKEL